MRAEDRGQMAGRIRHARRRDRQCRQRQGQDRRQPARRARPPAAESRTGHHPHRRAGRSGSGKPRPARPRRRRIAHAVRALRLQPGAEGTRRPRHRRDCREGTRPCAGQRFRRRECACCRGDRSRAVGSRRIRDHRDARTARSVDRAAEAADEFAFDTETDSFDPMQANPDRPEFAAEPGKAAYLPFAHDYRARRRSSIATSRWPRCGRCSPIRPGPSSASTASTTCRCCAATASRCSATPTTRCWRASCSIPATAATTWITSRCGTSATPP